MLEHNRSLENIQVDMIVLIVEQMSHFIVVNLSKSRKVVYFVSVLLQILSTLVFFNVGWVGCVDCSWHKQQFRNKRAFEKSLEQRSIYLSIS